MSSTNRLHYVLGLCILVIGFLFVLSWIPSFSIGNWTVRKVDPLAKIRKNDSNPAEDISADTLLAQLDSLNTDSVKQEVDSLTRKVRLRCPKGVTCIEDYSSDTSALKFFAKSLNTINQTHQAVRVAFYGDSFIEGDVFCGSLRDTLQSLYGGDGVGFVPITSEVAGFRTTIKHKFENWKTYSIVSKKDTSASIALGPSGYSFIPQENNWVEYKPSRKRNEFNRIKVYYRNKSDSAFINYTVNDTVNAGDPLKISSRMEEWSHREAHMKTVKMEFQSPDSLFLYGASFENGEGVYVDNFSTRGNSGIGLLKIPDYMLADFNRHRDYKLIILQYGLNAVMEDSVINYGWYAVRMIRVIEKIKKQFPKSSILLISVSDRSSNSTGEFKTMKGIPIMRDAQRLVAKKTGIAFWDLYEAMGGEDSMVKLAEADPPLAAKDFTHLTFKGGRRLAGYLAKSLIHESKKYAAVKK